MCFAKSPLNFLNPEQVVSNTSAYICVYFIYLNPCLYSVGAKPYVRVCSIFLCSTNLGICHNYGNIEVCVKRSRKRKYWIQCPQSSVIEVQQFPLPRYLLEKYLSQFTSIHSGLVHRGTKKFGEELNVWWCTQSCKSKNAQNAAP